MENAEALAPRWRGLATVQALERLAWTWAASVNPGDGAQPG